MAILGNGWLALRAGLVSQQRAIIGLSLALIVAATLAFAYAMLRRRVLLYTEKPVAPSAIAIAATAAAAAAACGIGIASLFATVSAPGVA